MMGAIAGGLGLSNGDKNKKEIEKLNKEIGKLQLDDNYNQTKLRRLRDAIFRDLLGTSDNIRDLSKQFETNYLLMKKKADTYEYDQMDKGDPLNLEAELGIGGKEDDFHVEKDVFLI